MVEVRETMWWPRDVVPMWVKSSSVLSRVEETQPMVFFLASFELEERGREERETE